MNSQYYKKFISPYLELKYVHILSKNDMHILGLKKRHYYRKLYTQIYIHLGSPCFRYCICKKLFDQDWDDLYYNYYLKLSPS